MLLFISHYFILFLTIPLCDSIHVETTIQRLDWPCQLDYHMQGEFTRQVNDIAMDTGEDEEQSKMHFLEAPVFEKFVITSSSVSLWGDCYRRLPGSAYIFGQSNKTLANDFASLPVCFRCISLISRTPNVIQSVHPDERICYDSIDAAEKGCFFDHQISSPVDGQLLFRTEYYDTNSCVTQGSYDVEYELRGSPVSILECPANRGSELSNCDGKNEWKLQFRNCSFSDFDLKLICLGKWAVSREIGAEHTLLIEHYLAVQNNATGGYKCGVMRQWKNGTIEIFFSADSSCFRLEKDGRNALEVYHLHEKNLQYLDFTPCRFPEWIVGEYSGQMSIETHQIRHRQSSSDMVVSRCVNVSDGLGNERIIVHSTTMCGVSLGFHCLWFRQRSNSVIEFKTTAVVSNPSQDICKNDRELDEHPWMTLLSSRSETSVCGLFGHYTTPKDLWLNGDCYNLSMDCDRLDNFKLVAFRCQTGEAYEVTHYTCHGTWREDATMFIYTKEASMQNIATNQTNQKQPECFMLREDSDGNIFLADLGSKQCDRDFDFTENGNKVMVLAQQQNCRSMTNSDQVRKRIKTLERPFSDSRSNLTMNDSPQSSAPNKSIPLILLTIFVILFNI